MKLTHSYSGIKNFQQCARQYHEVRILRKYKSAPTEATMYGERVHKAFELHIRDGEPLPEAFAHYSKFVEPVRQFDGEIVVEQKMGLRRDFSPCGFFDSDVWFRGVPDYLCINRETGVARVGDWKTGKSARFADTAQLELMAALVMRHYPEVEKVKGALLFVVAKDVIQATYTREQLPDILSKWAGYANQIEESTVWNPRPSGLCKFCPLPVGACEYR